MLRLPSSTSLSSRLVELFPSCQNMAQRSFAIAVRTSAKKYDSNDINNVSIQPTPSAASAKASSHQPLRAYPSYSVYGENCVLSVKIVLPKFSLLQPNNVMILDGTNKRGGRLLLEWTPRGPDGYALRDSTIRFGLSAEELGLILHQLPQHPVELARHPIPGGSMYATATTQDKILQIRPGQGGVVTFSLEQDTATNHDASSPPPPPALQVTTQAGEYMVIQEIMRSSITELIGWNTMLHVVKGGHYADAINPMPTTGGY